ncbi:MAG: peptidylprolyl isomerase [Coriobacteriia bacterium]|nr:peptidylprolyl isomerase [Coriobacteriia bacterium]
MAPKSGDTVRVHYRGTKSDGSEFDCSEGRDPLEFVVDEGQVIPGFNAAVSGLEVGEKITVTIPAAEAYGERYEEATHTFPLSAFPSTPEVGWMLELSGPNGERIPAMVAEVNEEEAVLDMNHPLAGEDLTFEIELVEIVEA